MPFTIETAKEAGRKGGSRLSDAQWERNRQASGVRSEKKTQAAQRNGLLGGAPVTTACTCGHTPHTSRCPIYLREKQRESRARKKLRGA